MLTEALGLHGTLKTEQTGGSLRGRELCHQQRHKLDSDSVTKVNNYENQVKTWSQIDT